ncbi:MAG: carbon storage regulator [Lacipirellulaceae bacterium]
MLVLSRKAGESVCIGENITIEVRRVAGNRVTIALHAPRDIRILRGELREAAEAFAPTEVTVQLDFDPATDGSLAASAYCMQCDLAPLAKAV